MDEELAQTQPDGAGGCGSRILGGCVSVVIPVVFILGGLGGVYAGLTTQNWLVFWWSAFIVLAGVAAMVQMRGIVRIPGSRSRRP